MVLHSSVCNTSLCILFCLGYNRILCKKKEVLIHPRILIHLQIITHLQNIFRMMEEHFTFTSSESHQSILGTSADHSQ